MSTRMHSYVDTNGDIHYGFAAELTRVAREVNNQVEEETMSRIQVNRKVTVTADDVTIEELIAALHGSCKEVLRAAVSNIVGTSLEEPARKLDVSTDFYNAPVGTIVDTKDGPHMKIFDNGWLWLADDRGENRTSAELVETDTSMSSKYIGTVLWMPEGAPGFRSSGVA